MNLKKKITGTSRKSEMLRFVMVGGFATALQYGVYVLLVAAMDMNAVVSTVVSYAISFVFNFVLSTRFTFHTHANARKGAGFAISHLINMGMQAGIVAIFKPLIGAELALLPALAVCVPVNYLLVRFALTSRRFEKN